MVASSQIEHLEPRIAPAATVELSSLEGANGLKICGLPSDIDLAVSDAGNINGNGIADMIIGAIFAGGNGSGYVVFGKQAAWARHPRR